MADRHGTLKSGHRVCSTITAGKSKTHAAYTHRRAKEWYARAQHGTVGGITTVMAPTRPVSLSHTNRPQPQPCSAGANVRDDNFLTWTARHSR